jgi:8-oxo-dGTP pyrophosphatase MutT (NUDIX family)
LTPAAPEPAATVCLVREDAAGLEVYLTRRQADLMFLGGFHVFPGGKVDPEDCCPGMLSRCRSLDPGAADPDRAAGFRVAAIREVFEETGVLLTEGTKPISSARLQESRRELHAGKRSFLSWLEAEDLYLPVDRLFWFAHWITPATSPRRFDTHFFAARMPAGQEAAPFAEEISASGWERPKAAIERWKRGEIKMIPPTLASLDFLSRFSNWEELSRQLQPQFVKRVGNADLGLEMASFERKQEL